MELIVGRIVKSHGIRGEVVVDIRTDSPEERFVPGATLLVRAPHRHADATTLPAQLTIAAARQHSGRLLVCFDTITDRTAAEALRGCHLLVDSANLAPLEDDDEFYDHELLGLKVLLLARDSDGEPDTDATPTGPIGTVAEIMHTAAGEILAIATPNDVPTGGQEILVPFVAQFVPQINLEHGTLTVCPPDGLLAPGTSEA